MSLRLATWPGSDSIPRWRSGHEAPESTSGRALACIARSKFPFTPPYAGRQVRDPCIADQIAVGGENPCRKTLLGLVVPHGKHLWICPWKSPSAVKKQAGASGQTAEAVRVENGVAGWTNVDLSSSPPPGERRSTNLSSLVVVQAHSPAILPVLIPFCRGISSSIRRGLECKTLNKMVIRQPRCALAPP